MSKYVIDSATLVSIGDAVREKDGTTAAILVKDIPARILAIETGGGSGGGVELPEEAYYVQNDCSYRFAYGGWDWFIEDFGDKMTTYKPPFCAGITDSSNMFVHCGVSEIPFDIYLYKGGSTYNMSNMFKDCQQLRKIPNVYFTKELDLVTSNNSGTIQMPSLFYGCYRLREIDYDFFNNMFTKEYGESALIGTGSGSARGSMFSYCYCLRKHPDLRRAMTGGTGSYNLYQNLFYCCYCLDEAVDIPIHPSNSTSSNMFYDTFGSCERLKRLTFAMQEDGTPYVRTWKNQTITLGRYTGYANSLESANNTYKTGLTTATQIKDDESYQRLKDNEDSWTKLEEYSRYNHDSAVETINSLPDVSSGSGNTLSIRGSMGSKTDGGAVNTLTEEEIAVATAKGWTVTLT